MTSPSRRKRPTTAPGPSTATTTACDRRRRLTLLAAGLALVLGVAPVWAQVRTPVPPGTPSLRATWVPSAPPPKKPGPVQRTSLQPPAPPLAGPDAIVAARTPATPIQVDPPGPQRLFRLDSESELLERIRQTGRQLRQQDADVFPVEEPVATEPYAGAALAGVVQVRGTGLRVLPDGCCSSSATTERYGLGPGHRHAVHLARRVLLRFRDAALSRGVAAALQGRLQLGLLSAGRPGAVPAVPAGDQCDGHPGGGRRRGGDVRDLPVSRGVKNDRTDGTDRTCESYRPHRSYGFLAAAASDENSHFPVWALHPRPGSSKTLANPLLWQRTHRQWGRRPSRLARQVIPLQTVIAGPQKGSQPCLSFSAGWATSGGFGPSAAYSSLA